MSDPIRSISQNNYILATQREVSHDNTLTGNGTPESPLGVANSSDETVLFNTSADAKTTSFTLSEALTNFEQVRFEITGYTNVYAQDTHKAPSTNNEEVTTCFTYYCNSTDNNPLQMIMGTYSSSNGLDYSLVRSKFLYMRNDGTSWNGNTTDGPHIQRIVGIGRKST